MAEKFKDYNIEVVGIEKGMEDKYKFIFETNDIGRHNLELNKKYYNIFVPGNKYLGKFKISGMSDFMGQEDNFENVCTVTFSLEKILEKDKVIWIK